MTPGAWTGAKRLATAAAVLAGYAVLLVTVPVAAAGGEGTAAQGVGYDGAKAYACALAWSLVSLGALALLARGPAAPAADGGQAAVAPFLSRRAAWIERGVVFAVFAGLYFPPFLARNGPYVEDGYFLAVLARMRAGQVPYADFEFLYGPLMIVPLSAWTAVAGLSLKSYYAFVAVVEGLQFAALMALLQRFVPDRRRRWAVFLLLTPLLFNTLLGLNWNALRRLVPVFAFAILLGGRRTRPRVLAAGALIGLHLAYSHDYAVACLLAASGTLAVMAFRGEGRAALLDGVLVCATAAAAWLAASVATMGAAFPVYVDSTRTMLAQFSHGAASFRFAWTVLSLALFATLALACAAVGPGLLRRGREPLSAGDRMLLASVLYALVTLRSGLNRADFWHLAAAFVPLVVTGLLPARYSAFEPGRAWRKAFTATVAVASLGYLVGSAPSLSYYAQGLAGGARDCLAGLPAGPIPPARTRGPALFAERTRPDPDLVAMAQYLADPARAAAPVLFYGACWQLPPQIGVVRTDYLVDDFMYLDVLRPTAAFLARHPDTVVVMTRPAYGRLFGLIGPDDFPESDDPSSRTATKRLGAWLASVHFEGIEHERRLKDRFWRARAGEAVRARWALAAEFGPWVVLEPRR